MRNPFRKQSQSDPERPSGVVRVDARTKTLTKRLQPGDVAVNADHCGIYIGGGQMIHCATYGVGVIIGPVQSGMVFVRY